jgi:hypothetical protein
MDVLLLINLWCSKHLFSNILKKLIIFDVHIINIAFLKKYWIKSILFVIENNNI